MKIRILFLKSENCWASTSLEIGLVRKNTVHFAQRQYSVHCPKDIQRQIVLRGISW